MKNLWISACTLLVLGHGWAQAQPPEAPLAARELLAAAKALGDAQFNARYANKVLQIKGTTAEWVFRSGVRYRIVDGVHLAYHPAFEKLKPGDEVVVEGKVKNALGGKVELRECKLLSPMIAVPTPVPPMPQPTPVKMTPPAPLPDGTHSKDELLKLYLGDATTFNENFANKTIRVRTRFFSIEGNNAGYAYLVFDGVVAEYTPELAKAVKAAAPAKDFLLEGTCKPRHATRRQVILANVKVLETSGGTTAKPTEPAAPRPADYDRLPLASTLSQGIKGKEKIAAFYQQHQGKTLRLRGLFFKTQSSKATGKVALLSRFELEGLKEADQLKLGQEVVFEAKCPPPGAVGFGLRLVEAKLIWAGPIPTAVAIEDPAAVLPSKLAWRTKTQVEFATEYVGKVVRVKGVFLDNFIVDGALQATVGAYEFGPQIMCRDLVGLEELVPGMELVVEGRMLKPSILDRNATLVECKLIAPSLKVAAQPKLETQAPKFAKSIDAEQYLEKKFGIGFGPLGPLVPDGKMRSAYAFKKQADADWPEIAGVLAQVQPSVALHVHGDIKPAQLGLLASVPKLLELSLQHNSLANSHTNAHFESIAQLGSLKKLEIRSTRDTVTKAGMESLGKLTGLEHLSLDLNCEDGDFAPLNRLTNLRYLSIGGVHASSEALSYLPNLKNLERIEGNLLRRWTDQTTEWFKNYPQLSVFKTKELSIYATKKMTDAGMAQLRQFPELEELFFFPFDFNPISEKGLKEIGQLRKLKRLSLNFPRVANSDGLKFLGELPDLENFHLQVNADLNGALVHLAGLKKLKRISLLYSFNDAGLGPLAKMGSLEEVGLAHNPKITDAGLKVLYGLPNLREISVAETAVTAAGVAALKQRHPKLKVLGP